MAPATVSGRRFEVPSITGQSGLRHVRAALGGCCRRGFVLRLVCVEFHSSASKHGVAESDVVHALLRTLVEIDLGDDGSPARRLVLGPDRAGNLLEIVVLCFDDDGEMVIHAMKMRSKYQVLIEGLSEGDE